MNDVYFRPGAGAGGVPADQVVRELERIRKERRELTASAVVEESRPRDAVLHSAFEWDDRLAAEAHRLNQARHLIKATVQVLEDEAKPVPVYFHVPRPTRDEDTAEGQYVPATLLVRQPDQFALAQGAAVRRLIAAQRDVEALKTIMLARTRRADVTPLEKAGKAIVAAQRAIEKVKV